ERVRLYFIQDLDNIYNNYLFNDYSKYIDILNKYFIFRNDININYCIHKLLYYVKTQIEDNINNIQNDIIFLNGWWKFDNIYEFEIKFKNYYHSNISQF